jgi:hypothetical protein
LVIADSNNYQKDIDNELCHLLQLILGCVVFNPKNDLIKEIIRMEESEQMILAKMVIEVIF